MDKRQKNRLDDYIQKEQPIEEEHAYDLGEYANQITRKKCTCGADLPTSAFDIEHYSHDGGWKVKGYTEKQWLYITCPNRKCGYQWSLWKLGVPR